MSLTLFRREVRAHWVLALVFAAVMTLYGSMIVSMFDPKLGESLAMMAESMPQIFAAFNMTDPGATLTEFLANYLYGFLFVVLPMVAILILAAGLVAGHVDKGSMAYLLASPHTRAGIVWTQAAVLFSFTLLLCAWAFGLCTAAAQLMFPGELDLEHFALLNVGLLGLHVFFGGLAFLCSCLFNETRLAAGIAAGLCVLFVLIQMLSQVGDTFDWLHLCTPLTLFDTDGLLAGDSGAIGRLLILYGWGSSMYCLGAVAFSRRDLPL